MLTGTELIALRIRLLGHEGSGINEDQLKGLATYDDMPFRPNPHGMQPCAHCGENEPTCEYAAERLDPAESERRASDRARPEEADGSVLVMGDLICRRCLAIQLPILRTHLCEIHWIELASDKWCPTSIVITTEAELDIVLEALRVASISGTQGAQESKS